MGKEERTHLLKKRRASSYGAIFEDDAPPPKFEYFKRDAVVVSFALVSALVLLGTTLGLGLPRLEEQRRDKLITTVTPPCTGNCTMTSAQIPVMNAKPKYISDLPAPVLNDLSRLLDVDDKWKKLGGNYMQVDFTTLSYMEHEIKKDKSPTLELLKTWSNSNGTVNALFLMLAHLQYQRAGLILLPYVDEKYHRFIDQGDYSTYSISSNSTASDMDSTNF